MADNAKRVFGLELEMLSPESQEMEINRAFVRFAHDVARRADRTLRAVILSGEGDSFCAGLDFATVLREPQRVAAAFAVRPWRGTNVFQEACWVWRRLPVPVIAAVTGVDGPVALSSGRNPRRRSAVAPRSVIRPP